MSRGAGAEYFREFGKVMEVVPVTLAENPGLNVIRVVTELRGRYARGAEVDARRS